MKTYFLIGLSSLLSLSYTTAGFSDNKVARQRPLVLAAVGDSITSGVNVNGWGVFREESWATGHSPSKVVKSFYTYLKEKSQRSIWVKNVARGGATSDEFETEIFEILEYEPDMVTVMFGGNDVCHWRESFESNIKIYRKNMAAGIDFLREHFPNIEIILLPIPDIYSLYDIKKNDKSCRRLWRLSNICRPLLSESLTPKDRLAFRDRINQMNQQLAEIAKTRTRHVYFLEKIKDLQFSAENISQYDCFHPSLTGQAKLGDKSWSFFQEQLVKRHINQFQATQDKLPAL